MKRILFNSSYGKTAFVLTGLTKEQNSEAKNILNQKGAVIEKSAKKDGTYYIIYNPDAPETAEVTKVKAAMSTWGSYILVPYEEFLKNAKAVTDEYGFVFNDDILFDYVGKDSEITIPNGIIEICDEAFQDNSIISKVTCPDTVKVIGSSAFYGCINLTEVVLPREVTSIGGTVFWGCGKLSSLVFPKVIKEIGGANYDRCKSLDQITVPACIKDDKSLVDYIGEFTGKVIVASDNTEYVSDESGLYNKDKTTLFYPGTGDISLLPDSLERIEQSFFRSHPVFKKLCLPDKAIKLASLDLFYISIDELKCAVDLVEKHYSFLSNYDKNRLPQLGYRLIGKKIITYNNESERILKELLKKYREEILYLIIKNSDTTALNEYLNHLSRVTVDTVEGLLQRVEENTELKAVLLDFKNKRFSKKDIDKKEQDDIEKALGIKELTPAEWRKEFMLSNIGEDAVRIEKYKGNNESATIPEKIGKRKVEGINISRFLESPVNLNLPASMIVPRAEVSKNDIVTGNIIEFGQYYESENVIAPIKWRVLNVQSDEAMLITDSVIDYMTYNQKRDKVYWRDCDLRKWLNNTFFSFAFTAEEQKKIVEKEISTLRKTPGEWPSAPDDEILTNDRVFLMSIDEAEKYFPNKDDRKAFPSQHCCDDYNKVRDDFRVTKGTYMNRNMEPTDPVDWALRSGTPDTGNPYILYLFICAINKSGETDGNRVEAAQGVRPVIFISIGR